jgi:hypothetical protein
LFEWSYEKASLGIRKKNGPFEVVEEAISPFDLQKQTNYHKRYQGNTAHNKIQEKKNLMLS